MITKRSKWSYAIGCTGRDLCYTLVSLFLLTYIQFTNLVNDVQFLVLSVIIVLCRVWDAVNDPMMGTIISNTRSRFGKYRPWLLIGAITNAVVLIVMFGVRVDVTNNIDTLGWWNVLILGLGYFIWEMTFTMNDVSYWSLLPVLAEDKRDRDKLTTMVAVFASVGAFAAGGLVPMLTTGNAITAYRLIGIIFALVFLVCQIMIFFMVRDNKENKFMIEIDKNAPKEKGTTLKDMFKILFRNKQLLAMAVVVLFYSLGSAILNAFGQNFFYFKFGYEGNFMFIFTVMYAIGTIVSQALFPVLSAKWKRNQIVKVSLIILTIGYILFFLFSIINVNPNLAFILLCISGVFVFVGQGFFYLTMLIMLTNTIEYDEWQTGERNDEIIFSVRPFMVKLAGAIQYLVVAVTLVACGLYSITEKIGEYEYLISTNPDKRPEYLIEINNLLSSASQGQFIGLVAAMTLIPVLLFIGCYFVLKKKYIIDEELYDKMVKEIAERK